MAPLDAVHYLIVGEGPERAALEARIEVLGIAPRVHFAGRVARDDLPQRLAEADLMVQPSIGVEAFGISVVEAMACALPVLASDIGGLPEIVVPGETGRLLPGGDVAAWRAAIDEARQHRDALRAWGTAGRRRVEADFTWARNAARLEALLEKGHR
jgi:glycosyltransferase involved in cell wall biosynthesis